MIGFILAISVVVTPTPSPLGIDRFRRKKTGMPDGNQAAITVQISN